MANIKRLITLPPAGSETFFLWGPRQAGKSTLLRNGYPNAVWIDLLKSEVLRKYAAAPQITNTRRNVNITSIALRRDFFRLNVMEIPQGTGSGFIWDDLGHVVTNNHVIEGADMIRVQLSDRREFDAALIGRDPTTDVALLRVDETGLTPVTLGSSDDTRVGEWVMAIGSPGFRGTNGPLTTTVTAGIVSAKGRIIGKPKKALQSKKRIGVSWKTGRLVG